MDFWPVPYMVPYYDYPKVQMIYGDQITAALVNAMTIHKM
jgi:hypothetical protein